MDFIILLLILIIPFILISQNTKVEEDNMLRVRVIANSNSEYDQKIKLEQGLGIQVTDFYTVVDGDRLVNVPKILETPYVTKDDSVTALKRDGTIEYIKNAPHSIDKEILSY